MAAKKVDTGPTKPTRISSKQARKGQKGGSTEEGKMTPMKSARANFAESVSMSRGGRNRGMAVLPEKISTERNGGTRQSRIQRGRQKPL